MRFARTLLAASAIVASLLVSSSTNAQSRRDTGDRYVTIVNNSKYVVHTVHGVPMRTGRASTRDPDLIPDTMIQPGGETRVYIGRTGRECMYSMLVMMTHPDTNQFVGERRRDVNVCRQTRWWIDSEEV